MKVLVVSCNVGIGWNDAPATFADCVCFFFMVFVSYFFLSFRNVKMLSTLNNRLRLNASSGTSFLVLTNFARLDLLMFNLDIICRAFNAPTFANGES